jgi:predicted nucleotidyltransferase
VTGDPTRARPTADADWSDLQPQHPKAIEHHVAHFRADPEAQALLLAGSIAHGFAGPKSDLDLLIVVRDAAYEARLREGRTQYASVEGCDWEGSASAASSRSSRPWHWYGHEALKLGDRHLLGTAVAPCVLFGGRMVLAYNELL